MNVLDTKKTLFKSSTRVEGPETIDVTESNCNSISHGGEKVNGDSGGKSAAHTRTF